MIEQIHMGNAAICTELVEFRLILRFHKSAKTDMLTPKDLLIFLHQWSNKYLFWYLQSSQSVIVGGQVFQSRLMLTCSSMTLQRGALKVKKWSDIAIVHKVGEGQIRIILLNC